MSKDGRLKHHLLKSKLQTMYQARMLDRVHEIQEYDMQLAEKQRQQLKQMEKDMEHLLT